MYGVDIPEDFADPEGLLHQADFFMMEPMKSAVSLIIAKTLSLETVKEKRGTGKRICREAVPTSFWPMLKSWEIICFLNFSDPPQHIFPRLVRLSKGLGTLLIGNPMFCIKVEGKILL